MKLGTFVFTALSSIMDGIDSISHPFISDPEFIEFDIGVDVGYVLEEDKRMGMNVIQTSDNRIRFKVPLVKKSDK